VSEHAFRLLVMGAALVSGLAVLCQICIVLRMYRVVREIRPRVEDLTGQVAGALNAATRALDENRRRISLIAEDSKDLSRRARQLSQRIASLREAAMRKKALMRTILFIRGISAAAGHFIHRVGRTDPGVHRKRDTLFNGR
jgi:hypothetical protein